MGALKGIVQSNPVHCSSSDLPRTHEQSELSWIHKLFKRRVTENNALGYSDIPVAYISSH